MTATAAPGADLVQLARTAAPAGAAAEWIEAHGFPTATDEDWRYLPIGSILSAAFRPAGPALARAATTGMVDALAPELGGLRLVFVNGWFAPDASSLAALPDGATVRAASSAPIDTRNRSCSARPSAPYRHAFEALNVLLTTDGADISVAAGVTVDEPIHLVYLSDPSGSPVVSSPRSTLVAGPGSRVAIAETFAGGAGAAGLTNAVTQIRCGEGAQVDHDRVQDDAQGSFHLSLLDVELGRSSRFSSRSIGLGASVARHEIRVRLSGDGAQATLDGLYLPRGDQHHDHTVLVEHAARATRSRQRYQGVADDNGHGVFNGRIVVHPGANGTDAEQTNRNLLLSDRAEIDTRPRLEIFADDVRCAHGATVGRLDESALYYLRSRGIPRRQAQALLVHAVADQTVRLIPCPALQADVARRVAMAISARGNASDDVR